MTITAAPTLFERAAGVFDGWTDPETGVRVLRVIPSNLPRVPGQWSTCYHQTSCFLDGGRRVLLRTHRRVIEGAARASTVLDLTTGQAEDIAPPGHFLAEVWDQTQLALLSRREPDGTRVVLWDLQAGRELASVSTDGWTLNGKTFLSDGRRALVYHYRGQYYTEPVQARHWLLTPGEPPQLVLEADGFHCSHIVGCPTDPNLYTYDRWPSPKRDIDQAITIRSVDGTFKEPVKLDAAALRPGDMWGARDHYVWTPDGTRIVSYLNPHPLRLTPVPKSDPDFNHFRFEWWLSALDWRTGADLAAKYPPGRWGGHMQVTPDSRYIVCAGGPGFDNLFVVEIEGLRRGWNEQVICSYPKTVAGGTNSDPFPYPFVLPDSSGVLFNAGWPGDQHGIYLAEWPRALT